MIILDGKNISKKIFENLKREISESGIGPKLAIVNVGKNPASQKFIAEKQKRAEEIGISIEIYNFKEDCSTKDLGEEIFKLKENRDIDGIIIQLPLPKHIDSDEILNLIPKEKDPDVLSFVSFEKFSVGASEILPPVAGAVREFFSEYGIDYKHAYTVVLGRGRLVGRPVAAWLKNEGATFAIVDENTKDSDNIIKSGDIIISGIGKPKIIGADIIKEGAVVIDAGTSESGGKLVGDVDFEEVAPKVSFITPVPGGVGPVTIAMLFSNLFTLAQNKLKNV